MMRVTEPAERGAASRTATHEREDEVREIELEVRNPSGLHARPAALFVKTAASFASAITVENVTGGKPPANAKSIIGLLTAGVGRGHRIRVVADGADEGAAVEALRDLVDSGVGEPLE